MCCICEQLSIIPLFILFANCYTESRNEAFFCVCFICRFDAVVISSEVGSEKPDANIFKAALGNV